MFEKDFIFEKLRDILQQMPTVNQDATITRESTLQGDLGLDSISGLGLLFMAEQEFNLKISDAQVPSLKTVGEVVDIIHEYVNAPGYTPPPM